MACMVYVQSQSALHSARLRKPALSGSLEKMKKNNENPEEGNKKRKPIPQIWSVIKKANHTFNAQLEKSNEVKLACLKKYAGGSFYDLQKFHSTFMEQVERMTDSKRYCKEAEAAGCDPTILATHIVFLGSAMVNRVLKLGLQNTEVARDIELYRETFLPDAQEFAKVR